ncbi:MAG TPA: alpha/beta fold hydrolase, partial [Steroidobacteraceae bacterium]|nr:alpha/beta fold hydrolase [Steroidobacteraceae bacterium]
MCAADKPAQHIVAVDAHPISVWSRVPAKPKYAILLVHGRTWSALPDFDLQVPGEHRSVMQALMSQDYATYAVDLRGYGSTPRNKNGWNTPNQAANDVAQVLLWIRKRHPQLAKPILFGWSNGSAVAHLTAQQYPDAFSDLVLYGFPR